MKKIEFTNIFPGLRRLLRLVIPKLLDFSNIKFIQSSVTKLETQHSINYMTIFDPEFFRRKISMLKWLIQNSNYSSSLVRLGGAGDGGYLVPKVYLDTNWLCFGLGQNIRFENDLVKAQGRVSGFDHTLAGRPRELNRAVNFVPKGWGLTDSNELLALSSAIVQHRNTFPSKEEKTFNYCLKFDIEGNEWNLIQEIAKGDQLPDVIICELHNLLSSAPEYWKKIEESLNILRLHYESIFSKGNNYSAHFYDEKTSLYDILEVTLIRKDKLSVLGCLGTKAWSHNQVQDEFKNFTNDDRFPIYPLFIK